MDNLFNSKKKIVIEVILLCIILIGGSVGAYEYNRVSTYNNLLTSANKNMDSGYYSKAIDLYTQSLKYKNDENVKKSINTAKKLDKMDGYYKQGIKLMNSKKYLEAIEQFNKVNNDDKKMYSNAKNKIKDCKSDYISQTMQLANDAYKNKNYDSANSDINEILKIDANNSDANNLKNLIALTQSQNQQTAQAQNQQQSKTNTVASSSNQQDSNFQKQWISGQEQWLAQQKSNQNNTTTPTPTTPATTTGNTTPAQNNTNTTAGNNNSQQNNNQNQALLASLKQQEAQAQQQLQKCTESENCTCV